MTPDFSDWVGRSEERHDTLEPARCNALLAMLGDEQTLVEGDPLPPLHHWLYFWDVRPASGLGIDGHPARGGFLPPVPLPRRMWAGGRVQFRQPLILGDPVTRVSHITKVVAKSGKSGDLVFVTVQHKLSGAHGLCVEEEQDIVYRGDAAPGSVRPAGPDMVPSGAQCQESVLPDTVMLFRYSALTMNGHRIHYDRPYAMDEESYPALVVHGPLQATLLARLAARHLATPLRAFDFRGQAPAFDGRRLHVCGVPDEGGMRLWTEQGGQTAMTASARG